MDCQSNDYVCQLSGIVQTLPVHLEQLFERIKPHLPWLGPLFGFVMWAWRQWDKREKVVFDRLHDLLGQQGLLIRQNGRYTLDQIVRPSPTIHPILPLFAVTAIRKLFAWRNWQPQLVPTGPMKRADCMLERTHSTLDLKDKAASDYRVFLTEQRFAAYILEGALASARSGQAKNRQEQIRLGTLALDKLQSALAVPGKSNDLEVLELKAIQLAKLRRDIEAAEEFNQLQNKLEAILDQEPPLVMEKYREVARQLIRVATLRAMLDHKNGNHGLVNTRLLELVSHRSNLFVARLEYRAVLERAWFHELHGCARAKAYGLGPAATASLNSANTDYNDLIQQLTPDRHWWLKRMWRWLYQNEAKDGTRELRREAQAGLKRNAAILAGQPCAMC